MTIKKNLIIKIAEFDLNHYLFMFDQLSLTSSNATKAFTTTPPKTLFLFDCIEKPLENET